jgi:glutamate 5-kinase
MKISLPNRTVIDVKRVVVKLGTKQITDLCSINYDNIAGLVREIVAMKKQGVEFIITASGAIGLGIFEMYNGKDCIDSLSVSQKQAIAGMGQVKLMEVFKQEFAKYHIHVGQVLLTHYIFDDRQAYLNARNTLNSMLEMGIVPVINENDSVATEEIKVGDNDRLGAFVGLLVDADLYIMLSDVDGLYKDFNSDKREFLQVVENVAQVVQHAGKQEEKFTKGGMITKLQAAKITTVSGVPSVIANGFKENIITKIFDDLSEGTIFIPSSKDLNYKKRWITGKKTKGTITVDDGAAQAVQKHKSLLASGIAGVVGSFKYGDTVEIIDKKRNEIAVGITNYSSDEIKLIAGKKSTEVEAILGKDNKYSSVVHVDNMVLFEQR